MTKRSQGRRGNLPAELTSMVGRRAETKAVRQLLGTSRLVTLTGTGGVGKTRLALHVARQVQSVFPGGVWLIPLAELTQPDLLALTILSELTRSGRGPGAGVAELTDFIGDSTMLLILDNAEHLIDACAKLTTELLRTCPNLTVLATSREALRIDGEVLFEVPPLAVPNGHAAAAALTYDSVRLFVDRASAVSPDFSLPPEDEQAVVALCQHLDGLPLAIELAAMRTRVLPIGELLARGKDRFQILTAGSRTAPSRHQTLRATVSYSYELCSTDARRLWARMSVFSGGAGLDAVETVCAADGRPAHILAQALSELVDKSIITFHDARYHMLETIREYGLERLRELGEEQRTRLAHRDYFAGLAEELEVSWLSPDQPEFVRKVSADHANVRAALQFCLTEPGQAAAGLRMASQLWNFWVGCGLYREGRRWLDRLLAADVEPTRERVRALWRNASLIAGCPDLSAGFPVLDECDELARRLDDQDGIAHATVLRGFIETRLNQNDQAIAHLTEAVRLGRLLPAGDPQLPEALLGLGVMLCYTEQPDRAIEVLEEAKDLSTVRGEQWLLCWCEVHLGLAALLKGRDAEATALLKQALTRQRALTNLLAIGLTVEFLAWAALDGGDPERSVQLLGASLALAEPLGAHLLGNTSLLRWHDEHFRRARAILGQRAFDRALQRGHAMSRDSTIAYGLGERLPTSPAPTGEGEDLPLTPRERQIARLVASGKMNREIAAELVIAVRTVDTHVENILTKLGFTSRTQIAALLGGRPDTPNTTEP